MRTEPSAPKALPIDGGPSFTLSNRIVRALWIVAWVGLASWTPRAFHPWRRTLLRLFGAQMGWQSDVRGSARVWLPSNLEMGNRAVLGPAVRCYNQARIRLGERALVSQNVHLCAGTHDVDDPSFELVAKPIAIGAFAWVAADAFVGPGCVIGEGAVVGARCVAFGTLEEWSIYSGNPARRLRARRRIPNP